MSNIYSWKEKSPLPEAFGQKYIAYEDNVDTLIELFINTYSAVRTYHLCRPVNEDSYINRGIKVGNAELLINNASEILTELNKSISKNTIANVLNGLDYSSGCLYLALDDEFMLEFAGHYAIYGSERLIAVFERLGVSKEQLASVGRPTIININLPIEAINFDDLHNFIIDINNAIIDGDQMIDFAFLQERCISADLICQLEYPTEIVNRHDAGRIHRVCN
ncbi:hypothetical protein PVK62_16685 [Aliivibrio sp. S3MY1]|uniref:hypothetical protein n=1 Tax=unclassified Aliivibrio TaxID=2645654 RepID=UPI002379F965|nr:MULTISPECIES: hypothetical protein [unclassified Aliivibrio]MDD9197463.1 hypothetical protein [Aliivibrio sp. S3MY1]MDD9200721.1 hypothetical protein [Aliivibrio sp. S2MY1]